MGLGNQFVGFFPREDYFSFSQYSLVDCSSLSKVEVSRYTQFHVSMSIDVDCVQV